MLKRALTFHVIIQLMMCSLQAQRTQENSRFLEDTLTRAICHLQEGQVGNAPSALNDMSRQPEDSTVELERRKHGIIPTRAPCALFFYSANKGLPLPLGRGVCETKSKNGRSRPRIPFISRLFCDQRGSETMVRDHDLGRGRTMG